MSITLETIASGYNLAKINSNFKLLEDKINNEILLRSGGGNSLLQDLDVNSNRVYNLVDAVDAQEAVTYGQLLRAMLASGAASVLPLVQPTQVADGVLVEFDSPSTVDLDESYFFVNLSGVSQKGATDFTINSTGKVVFDVAPPNGVEVDITIFAPQTS